MPIRLLAAALLLAGCVTAPTAPPSSERHCPRWRWSIDPPHLQVSVDASGQAKPNVQLGARLVCLPAVEAAR